MRISELITELEKLRSVHGDIDVYVVYDFSGGGYIPLKSVEFENAAIEIVALYGGADDSLALSAGGPLPGIGRVIGGPFSLGRGT